MASPPRLPLPKKTYVSRLSSKQGGRTFYNGHAINLAHGDHDSHDDKPSHNNEVSTALTALTKEHSLSDEAVQSVKALLERAKTASAEETAHQVP